MTDQGTAMESSARKQPLNPFIFSLLSVLVGVISGLGAVVLRALIAFFHNLLFLGKISLTYEANIHTPASPWGVFVILVPVVGALGVSFLVTKFAPEAKGHGAPEVMDSIYYNRGIIRPVVAVIKSLASALSIGSGGAVGREGPMVQIGSSFGSTLGQVITMPAWQRVTLVGAGAAAGIAATFNTPIGGMFFAIEIMLHEVSVRTLVPVIIATATATYVGQYFLGAYPAFVIPELQTFSFQLTNPLVLLSYVGLGLLMGVASAIYIRSIYAFEDFFEKYIGGSSYRRHMLGMFVVGLIFYFLISKYGHYYVEGVGYATIQDILTGKLTRFYLLLLLCLLELFTTSITLGSGASGGIFSPALFIGATLGGAYGAALRAFAPSPAITIPAFAIAGMAGVVGGSTGAAMAAIAMLFEMTLDYNVILPITITVALANGFRSLLLNETIYTLKLTRRGHYMPMALQANFHYLKRAKELMEKPVLSLPASTTIEEFAQFVLDQPKTSYVLVISGHEVVGVVSRDIALKALDPESKTNTLGDIAIRNVATVSENETSFHIINIMRNDKTSIALVSSNTKSNWIGNIKGLITKEIIADATAESITLFSE